MPEIEARETAAFVHLSWEAFLALPYDEQVAALAHHRTHNLIELHTSDAHVEQAERRSRANNR